MAMHLAPAALMGETDEMIATLVAIMEEQQEAIDNG